TVKKLTDPAGDPATFDFSGDLTGTIGDGQQVGPQAVKPGSYSTTEDVTKGGDLTKMKCSHADSSGDTAAATATYNVAAGENVACTYTYTTLFRSTVKKLTDPAGDPATFDFSGDLTGTIGDGQQVGPQAVKPGSYSTT